MGMSLAEGRRLVKVKKRKTIKHTIAVVIAASIIVIITLSFPAERENKNDGTRTFFFYLFFLFFCWFAIDTTFSFQLATKQVAWNNL